MSVRSIRENAVHLTSIRETVHMNTVTMETSLYRQGFTSFSSIIESKLDGSGSMALRPWVVTFEFLEREKSGLTRLCKIAATAEVKTSGDDCSLIVSGSRHEFARANDCWLVHASSGSVNEARLTSNSTSSPFAEGTVSIRGINASSMNASNFRASSKMIFLASSVLEALPFRGI